MQHHPLLLLCFLCLSRAYEEVNDVSEGHHGDIIPPEGSLATSLNPPGIASDTSSGWGNLLHIVQFEFVMLLGLLVSGYAIYRIKHKPRPILYTKIEH